MAKLDLQALAARILKYGTVLTVTSTAAIAAASLAERGSPWAGFNAICHMVDGDERSFGDNFDTRDTLLGMALNKSAIFMWAAIFVLLFGKIRGPKAYALGAAYAAGAYATDYRIVPKRFTPGFEKKLGTRSLLAIYTILGLTLGALANGAVTREK